MTSTSLISIISSGGNIIIDASKYETSQLISFASSARSHNTKVYLKNTYRLDQPNLISIASAGAGAVIFDFTE